MKKSTSIGMAVVTTLALQFTFTSSLQAQDVFSIKDGTMERPTGYREWIFVGSPLTPNDMNDGKAAFPEFHNVYIDPVSWEHWKKTGEFADGTTLIKDLVSVGGKTSLSGNGYFQGEYTGLAAMVKSKKHFPNEPGNWGFFSFVSKDNKTLTKTAKALPTASCNSCHQAAPQDLVFTNHYPVLRAAKGQGIKGTGGFVSELMK